MKLTSTLRRTITRVIPLLALLVPAGAHTQNIPPAPGRSPILEQAAQGIETHRKGNATVRFVAKNGAPLAGTRVEITQRTHDFAFGNLIRPRHYTNELYRSRFLEIFNFVQLLEFNWGQYEREEGKPRLAERRAFIDGWCRSNGLTRFYGHMLTWAYQMDEPRDIGPINPFWLMRYDREAQFRLLRRRIEREVRDYRDVNILWDVVNEPVHCRRWGDWSKPNDVDEPIADVLPYVRDALHWAHEANPKARLMINEYRILPNGKYRERYRELITALKKENAPLHAVGIQAHSPGNGAHWFSPEEIWQTCELFGKELGLPIHFTEFWQNSDPKQKVTGAHPPGNWSPQLQADAIEQFYRVAFGHPAVESIIYFGMIDGETESPTLGLLDGEFRPKPAWTRLKKLIKEEWTTRQSVATDASGNCKFRGFFGDYDVRVTSAGNKERAVSVHVAPGKPNAWQFTIE
ncbi:MAG TPA: endo-1,4-beta-xylanase [Verrucomicrobiae bacterium]|nr:endo-1,4-beta-xylanase [Verrucomicrobiae bacterium]